MGSPRAGSAKGKAFRPRQRGNLYIHETRARGKVVFSWEETRARPTDLQEIRSVHVPEGHLTVAHHFSGGKTRPFFPIQSRRDG